MKNTLLFLFAALAWSATALCQTPADSAARPRKRVFIAHRGVNMRSTVAGENSLEAIRLAKAAGFGAIETDVRLSADGALVVMHDSTLNRTCLHADGTPLSEPVAVAGKTLRELRSDYILKAADTARRTRIPTLEEYLAECARNGLYTFIEPKLYDPTGRHYRDIVAAADAALGRDRYVVTSNNRANDVIRRTGIDDVRLMGILYQTTFERIEALGDVIVAVSATRFDEADYSRQVARVKAAGLMCESHADKFVHFDRINRHDIDFVSTDFLAPDYHGQGRLLAVPFGALYLELEAEGSARIELGGQTFTLDVPDKRTVTHQVLLHDAAPALRITALAGGTTLTAIRAKVVAFEQ